MQLVEHLPFIKHCIDTHGGDKEEWGMNLELVKDLLT